MSERLVLASASPRRAELLRAMGLAFEVATSGVDEDAIPADHPRTFALRAAYAKASAVAEAQPEGTWVLGCDTVVTRAMKLYGKPRDERDAAAMLRDLSGAEHDVITAVALARAGAPEVHLQSATTRVLFRALSDGEILRYVQSSCPMDKAGAYGIQAGGGDFVERIEGDYHNVVGLPCALVGEMLREHAGIASTAPVPPARWR